MNRIPLISILMNCFNGEIYLEEAINSVLKQSYQNWELIFWDNKSSDRSVEIVSNYRDQRIRIFRSDKHTNLGKARKEALKNAKGDYLAFLDVDDIWAKNKLKNQIKVFNNHEVGIAFTNAIFFNDKRKETLYKNSKNLKVTTNSLIMKYPITLVSVMIDLKKLKKLSYDFDSNYSHISDFDLIIRLSSISKVKYLEKVLCGWRIHNKNESFTKKELFNNETEAWCNFHIRNKFLRNFRKEIKGLKSLVLARKRILNNGFYLNNFKDFKLSNQNSFENNIYIILSYIPLIPKLIYVIKDFNFRRKWS